MDMMRVKALERGKPSRLIGRIARGIITPGGLQDRHHAGYIHSQVTSAHLGSGTLTYEAVWQLTRVGAVNRLALGSVAIRLAPVAPRLCETSTKTRARTQ